MVAELAKFGRVLVVCAHPDDESFGLGGVLAALVDQGASVRALCFTRGEASTLGPGTGDLAALRAGEVTEAASILGLESVELLDYADGCLESVPVEELVAHVRRLGAGVDALVAFDELGVTGHRDHVAATQVAVQAAAELGVPVLAWSVPAHVAAALNAEFGAAFIGRQRAEVDLEITVTRERQLRAIACHRTQQNPVVGRRLTLQGDREWLRVIAPATRGPS